MCMFCAAIPVAASTGVALNAKQLKARRMSLHGEEDSEGTGRTAAATPELKPIMQVTAGVVVLLLIGSVTYHTLTYLP